MRQSARWNIAAIFLFAVAANYPWELAQTPFYAGIAFPAALWHCFLSALGDGVMVLFIYASVAAAMRSLTWHRDPTVRAYAVMAAVGLALAILVEWWGLHVARRWQYSALMPIIPGTGIGMVPILQMLLLPPAILAAARRLAA